MKHDVACYSQSLVKRVKVGTRNAVSALNSLALTFHNDLLHDSVRPSHCAERESREETVCFGLPLSLSLCCAEARRPRQRPGGPEMLCQIKLNQWIPLQDPPRFPNTQHRVRTQGHCGWEQNTETAPLALYTTGAFPIINGTLGYYWVAFQLKEKRTLNE